MSCRVSTVFCKTPSEVLDYAVNWSSWLNGGQISTSSWTLESGIAEDSSSNTTTKTTIWISGGTARCSYTVTNTIVTVSGRTAQRTFNLHVVKER